MAWTYLYFGQNPKFFLSFWSPGLDPPTSVGLHAGKGLHLCWLADNIRPSGLSFQISTEAKRNFDWAKTEGSGLETTFEIFTQILQYANKTNTSFIILFYFLWKVEKLKNSKQAPVELSNTGGELVGSYGYGHLPWTFLVLIKQVFTMPAPWYIQFCYPFLS